MDYRERIISDPTILMGKPVVKGTRISVELILKRLSEGASVEDVLAVYPNLKKEDILAVLAYSADAIGNEAVIESSHR